MAVAVQETLSLAPAGGRTDAGQLFEQYSDRVLAYCLSYLKSRAEAEDALQTTFLYAHRALRRGVVPADEYAWLHTIARNVCHTQKRTQTRRGPLTGHVDMDTFAAPLRDPDAGELASGLSDALASIPESQRHALILSEWRGLTSAEIGSRLGLTASATQARLTRARRSLAKALVATPKRAGLGLNLGGLVFKLKALVTGGTAHIAAATTVVAGIGIAGVAVERALAPEPGQSAAPTTTIAVHDTRRSTAPRNRVAAKPGRAIQSQLTTGAPTKAPAQPAATTTVPLVPATPGAEEERRTDVSGSPSPTASGHPSPAADASMDPTAPHQDGRLTSIVPPGPTEIPSLVDDLLEALPQIAHTPEDLAGDLLDQTDLGSQLEHNPVQPPLSPPPLPQVGSLELP